MKINVPVITPLPQANKEEAIKKTEESVELTSAPTTISKPDTKIKWRVNKDGAAQSYFELTGSTLKERSINLLNKYGHTNYQDWLSGSIENNIKPEVVICIAKADSFLGKMLTTKNNYGNVGNNDRGERVEYASPKAGIAAIAKVLNGKYLKTYNTIGELSYGGLKMLGIPRQGRHIYASSEENWNNNVMNCLDAITGRPQDEKYEFRLYR